MTGTGLNTSRSRELHERARRHLPLGVNGDGRFTAPFPIIFASARGKWLDDVDGNRYLDYHGGFGTAVLGYAHPEVDAAVQRGIAEVGAFVGVPNVYEEELAERLCALLPGAERVVLAGGGGSDVLYHAVRLARAATGRTKIVKIEGGYQGWHADIGVSTRPQLADARPVGLPDGVANSPGSLPAVTAEVLVAEVNDDAALERLFETRGHEIAAMVIEPVLYSCGCVHVEPTYLQLARDLCTAHGSVLVFDEIMSGFRADLRGAGARLGVVADLTAYGKAIANGYVLAVLAGREDLMTQLSPEGKVFFSGTFNGHPLSVIAAQTTLDVLERDDVPARLSLLGDKLAGGINAIVDALGLDAVCQTFGSVWNLYFGTTSVRSYRDLHRSTTDLTRRLGSEYLMFLREQGIYLHNRHVNRGFISAAHDDGDIERTIAVVGEFLERRQAELAR
jgi:glutamate-1-semialdehyde 2,1-aminomutase